MDILILAILIASGTYMLNAKEQRKRIALLGSHLANYQIEKLMEALTDGYLRALGESTDERRQIMQQQRMPILMFSSLTHEGAKATLDALEAGAVDFLPKKFEDIARDKDEAGQLLRDRVRAVARKRQLGRPTFSSTVSNRAEPAKPTDPVICAATSLRISPYKLGITITSKASGVSAILAAPISIIQCSFSISGYSLAISSNTW